MLDHAIRLVLDSIGRSEEYEYYISRFQSDKKNFLVICPDQESLGPGSAAIAELIVLVELGLFPAILLSGPERRRLKERFLEASAGSPSLQRIVLLESASSLQSAIKNVAAASSKRLLFLRNSGPLHDEAGQKLSFYNVNSPVVVSSQDAALAELATACLLDNPELHVAVCDPYSLLREVFTVKGAGTIIRRRCEVQSCQASDPALVALIEKSFGRRLKPGALEKTSQCYVADGNAGAILIEETPSGSYLAKFAVDKQARGAGVALDLWEHVSALHPALFWRSRFGNFINRWYSRLSDGEHRSGEWVIFWKGVPPEKLPEVIGACLLRPPDFEDA